MVSAVIGVSSTLESPAFLHIRLRREAWEEVNAAITEHCLRQNINGYCVQWEATDSQQTKKGKSTPRRRHV